MIPCLVSSLLLARRMHWENDMNKTHESNRAVWNHWSNWWGRRRDEKGVWNRCHRDPTLVLCPGEMACLGQLQGKKVCVLASGDNEVAFALAGMGAQVTSVDISEGQLAIAERRARTLGLDMSFVRADVTELDQIEDAQFDFTHSGAGVWIWMSDIRKYYAEAARILKPGGLLVVNDAHPFNFLFSGAVPSDSYYDRGPFPYTTTEGMPACEHFWTVADQLQAALDVGCDLVRVEEHEGTPADRIQEGLNRKEAEENGEDVVQPQHPRLPEWLLIVARKRAEMARCCAQGE